MQKPRCLDPCRRTTPDGTIQQDITCCDHGFGTQSIPSHNWRCSNVDKTLVITFAGKSIDAYNNVRHDSACKDMGMSLNDDLVWSGDQIKFNIS